MMRILFGSLALLIVASVQPAGAIEYPWCAHYGKSHGGTNCGFVSWQQCRMAISGNGGDCQPNPFYAYAQPPRAKKVRYYYR